MNNGKLYNVLKVFKDQDARARIACLPLDKASNQALQEALAVYNRWRDHLSTWPNAKDLVVLRVRETLDGYDVLYNDNPSMSATLNKEVNFLVIEVTGY